MTDETVYTRQGMDLEQENGGSSPHQPPVAGRRTTRICLSGATRCSSIHGHANVEGTVMLEELLGGVTRGEYDAWLINIRGAISSVRALWA